MSKSFLCWSYGRVCLYIYKISNYRAVWFPTKHPLASTPQIHVGLLFCKAKHISEIIDKAVLCIYDFLSCLNPFLAKRKRNEGKIKGETGQLGNLRLKSRSHFKTLWSKNNNSVFPFPLFLSSSLFCKMWFIFSEGKFPSREFINHITLQWDWFYLQGKILIPWIGSGLRASLRSLWFVQCYVTLCMHKHLCVVIGEMRPELMAINVGNQLFSWVSH